MRRALLVGLMGLFLASASGCSHLLVRRAPDPVPRRQWVMCTENRVVPLADAAITALLLSPIVYFAGFEPNSSSRTLGLVVSIPIMGTAAALFGWSSFVGFQETARCGQVHHDYERGPEQPPDPDEAADRVDRPDPVTALSPLAELEPSPR